jgi:hypothetical protein
MNYQALEQLTCKLAASNDIVSQGACWLNFEAQYPPGSQAYNDLVDGIGGSIETVAIIVVVVIFASIWRLGVGPKHPKPTTRYDRREPRL